MKIFFLISILFLTAFSCSGKKEKFVTNPQEQNVQAPYDTVAIDSFSNGAISVDVADRIRRSSVAYQDSIKQEIEKQKEEAEVEKEEKNKKEDTKQETQAAAEPEKSTPEKTETTN